MEPVGSCGGSGKYRVCLGLLYKCSVDKVTCQLFLPLRKDSCCIIRRMKEPEDCVSRPFTLLTRPIGGGSLSSGGCTVRSSNVLGPCYHGWSKVKNAGRPGTRASFLYSHVIYEARSLQVPFTKPAVAGKQLRRQQKREFGGSAIVACWVPKLKLGFFCACDTTVLLR